MGVLLAVALLPPYAGLYVLAARVVEDERHNTQALCAFRGDLKSRLQSGTEFLKKHPGGIPGISGATIRTSLVNERRTVDALRPVVCSGNSP